MTSDDAEGGAKLAEPMSRSYETVKMPTDCVLLHKKRQSRSSMISEWFGRVMLKYDPSTRPKEGKNKWAFLSMTSSWKKYINDS